MNKKLYIAIPLLFLLSIGFAGQSLAQTRLPGVTFSDSFVFNISSTWNTNNASAIDPPYLVQINETRAYNLTVTYVIGNNVTAQNTWSFTNGTDIPSYATVNTDTGELLDSIPGLPAFQGFFDANLGVNDLIHPGGNDSITINQTISQDYASGKRDTNVVEYSYQVSNFDNSSKGTETQTLHIDKATGILVERKVLSVFPDQNGTEFWTLQSTNVWTVSAAPVSLPLPLPIIVAIVAVIVVVIVAVVYLKSRKGKRRKLKR